MQQRQLMIPENVVGDVGGCTTSTDVIQVHCSSSNSCDGVNGMQSSCQRRSIQSNSVVEIYHNGGISTTVRTSNSAMIQNRPATTSNHNYDNKDDCS